MHRSGHSLRHRVWGIEADIQSLDLSDSHGGKFRYTTNNAPYNLSTPTPRMGYSRCEAGLATPSTARSSISPAARCYGPQRFSEPPFTAVPAARANKSSTEAGWVIGGGWEYGLAQNWTLRGEYFVRTV